jgi:hypothetical protein
MDNVVPLPLGAGEAAGKLLVQEEQPLVAGVATVVVLIVFPKLVGKTFAGG